MRSLLALLALPACSSTLEGESPGNTRYVDVVVSDAWAPDQIEAALTGTDFWAERLDVVVPGRFAVIVSVGACDVEDLGCIAPVPFEHPALRDYEDGLDNGSVVGSCVGGKIAVWEGLPIADLDVLIAHELGHFIGLGHDTTPGQIMAPGTGEMAFALSATTAALLHRM